MATLFSFLLSAVGPLALRILAQLGIGLLTFTGVDTALNGLIQQAQTSWSGMPADVLALAGLAGIPACLGIVMGAMNARVAVWVAAAATRWIVKGS
jgi:hypothetical protein